MEALGRRVAASVMNHAETSHDSMDALMVSIATILCVVCTSEEQAVGDAAITGQSLELLVRTLWSELAEQRASLQGPGSMVN